LRAAAEAFLVQSRTEVPIAPRADAAPRQAALRLTAVLIDGSGWREPDLGAGISEAIGILGQCGVTASGFALLRVTTPPAYRDLSNPESRTLAATLAVPRPTLYFVRDTRNRPAFDAEAFGGGNTRSRPELTHSVWITRQAPDLPETLAHELFHVLANSGAHSDDPANLMYPRTAPGRHLLSRQQCAELLDTGLRSGLLERQ
jgi:hypothetical protein